MNALPKGVLTNVLAPFVSARDVGRLSQTCRTLRDRVHALGVAFWTLQISRDFGPADVAVTWIKEERDPKLAKTCYVALHFLREHALEGKKHLKEPLIPAPVRASFLLKDITKDGLIAFFGTLSESEKERFYPFLADSLEMLATTIELPHELVQVLARFVQSKFLKMPNDRRWVLKLFQSFCGESLYYWVPNFHSQVDRMLALNLFTREELNECLHLGDLHTTQKLLDAGANPAEVPHLLHYVIDRVSRSILRPDELYSVLFLLINHGASVTTRNRFGRTPLRNLIQNVRGLTCESVRLLASHDDLQTLKENALFCLQAIGSIEMLNLLQELGAYPCEKDENGNTALHFVNKLDLELLRALLEAGEDPNAENIFNQTPLGKFIHRCKSKEELYSLLTLFHEFGADFKNHPEILSIVCQLTNIRRGKAVRFLLEQGVPFNVPDRNGWRPLGYAIAYGKGNDAAKALLEAGDSCSNSNDRFYLACWFGELEIIKTWEGNGMIPSHSVEAAIKCKHWDVVRYLFYECKIEKNPFSYFLECEDECAITILKELYERHPEWLFIESEYYWKGKSMTLFEALTEKMTRVPNLNLFRLVKGWIDTYPPDQQERLYGKALWRFVTKCCAYATFLELPVELRTEMYDALFTQQQIDSEPRLLYYVYLMIIRNGTVREHWEEIKERLEPFNLNFGPNLACLMDLDTTKFGDRYTEAIEVLREMIRFAWDRGLKEKTLKGEICPLKSVVCSNGTGFPRIYETSYALVGHFIELGHPVDIKDEYGNTPLELAISAGSYLAAQRLVDAGAKYDGDNIALLARMGPYRNLLVKDESSDERIT